MASSNHRHLLVVSIIIMIGIIMTQGDSSTENSKEKINLDFKLKMLLPDDNDQFRPDPKIPMAEDPRFNKMLPKPETPADKFKPDPKIPMADDPRFNKMLQSDDQYQKIDKLMPIISTSTPIQDEIKKIDKLMPTIKTTEKTKVTTVERNSNEKKSSEREDSNTTSDYYDDDYSYYEYDDSFKDLKPVIDKSKLSSNKTDEKLKPIKGNAKNTFEDEIIHNIEEIDDDIVDINEDSSADVKEDILFNENVPCPRDCICERNLANGFIVATCNRLDASIQKFGADITDVQVLNASPKFPIILGPAFFQKIGLKHVSSIKIVDSTIHSIHPSAFEGLDTLYSVNLTNCGLAMVHPDTFAQNHKLRLLSLSGNDLNAMQQKSSPFVDYMLKAPSVEELDLSRCNLKQLLPTAFDKLENIVYINLADNQLKVIPDGLFDKVETIEELDLSLNSIEKLSKSTFIKTSLAILNLNYNNLETNLDFITSDLQKLDLDYNKITTLNDLTFSRATGLNSLTLKGNSIKKIHPAAFHSLKNLRFLDLSFNRMTQLSSQLFLRTRDLEVVKLNDNPRLTELPLEGFETEYNYLNIYHFDISNCDISELGDNTFSTMTGLTVLNLSWNNLDNLNKGLFSYLSKLTDLDVSNNLLTEMNDLLFMHNRNLKKLNIAGNPVRKVSTKLFLPTKLLLELDMSDCSLNRIWAESSAKMNAIGSFENLRILNVSNNEIDRIYMSDLEVLKNLQILDISENRLHCDNDFRNLMKWLGKKKIRAGSANGGDFKLNAKLKKDAMFIEDFGEHSWSELARRICQKDTENYHSKDVIDTLESSYSSVSSNSDRSSTDADGDDEDDDDDDDDVDDDDDDDDEDDDDDADDDDEYDDESVSSDEKKSKNSLVSDNDVKNAEKKISKMLEDYDKNLNTLPFRIKDKGLFAHELDDQEAIIDGLDDDDDQIVLRQRQRTYYSQYGFMVPIIIIVFSVLALLLVVSKVISLMRIRRDARYQQNLLAAKFKNSIVYQKLTEDLLDGKIVEPKKNNKYTPIAQV